MYGCFGGHQVVENLNMWGGYGVLMAWEGYQKVKILPRRNRHIGVLGRSRLLGDPTKKTFSPTFFFPRAIFFAWEGLG